MNIKVIQHADKAQGDLLAATSKINKKYCQKHGYKYEHFLGNYTGVKPTADKFSTHWNKIILTRKELPSADWLLYMDADVMIKEPNRPLEDFIGMSNREWLVCGVSRATSAEKHWNVNCGVYFIKNTAYMREIVDDMIQFFNFQVQSKNHIPSDQPMWHKMLQTNHKDISKHVDIFPSTAFNHNGKFLRHYLGQNFESYEKRVEAVKKDAPLVF
jgi:hypothetical protein